MDVVILLVFISLGLVAASLFFFVHRLAAGDFDHAERLALAPLDDDPEPVPSSDDPPSSSDDEPAAASRTADPSETDHPSSKRPQSPERPQGGSSHASS